MSPPLPAPRADIILLTGTLSPVSAASSILRLALSNMRQSAGTASPASSTTISPTVRSSLLTVVILPSRMTFEVAALISCSASIAFSALLSCKTPSTAFMSTTARIITVSVGKDGEPETLPSYTVVTADITAATIRIIIIGSASCSRNRLTSDFCFACANLFLPYFSRRRSASDCVSPFSELSVRSNTSRTSSR